MNKFNKGKTPVYKLKIFRNCKSYLRMTAAIKSISQSNKSILIGRYNYEFWLR